MMIETLETRRMLSATATVVQGCDGTNTLVVTMTSADNIQVQEFASAKLNGTVQSNVVNASFYNNVTSPKIGQGGWANISHISIQGSSGNDVIQVSAQNASVAVEGGAGNDIIIAYGQAVEDYLGNLVGPQTATFNIDGGDGNDIIQVFSGLKDIIYGGNGNDTLFSANGVDQLIDGGNGSDDLIVADTGSIVTGGNGTDTLIIFAGSYIVGSNGKDIIDTNPTADDPLAIPIIDAMNTAVDAALA